METVKVARWRKALAWVLFEVPLVKWLVVVPVMMLALGIVYLWVRSLELTRK
jgi:hypothetical protein